ncbi:hypothetical protein HaLaN_10052, partial [Haematococcus lacustris]
GPVPPRQQGIQAAEQAALHCCTAAIYGIYGISLLAVPFPLHLCIFTQSCIFHGKPKLLEKATARRTAHRVVAKKKHKKDPGKKRKAKRSKPAAEPTKGKGKAAKAKPAPQPGRWLDRDCNAALNMQRIGESRWRPLELCY